MYGSRSIFLYCLSWNVMQCVDRCEMLIFISIVLIPTLLIDYGQDIMIYLLYQLTTIVFVLVVFDL